MLDGFQFKRNPKSIGQSVQVLCEPRCELEGLVFPDVAETDWLEAPDHDGWSAIYAFGVLVRHRVKHRHAFGSCLVPLQSTPGPS